MTIEAIRRTRLDGKKPALVYVVIGPHAQIHDDKTMVCVPDGARPEGMDWRPLVGVRVALIQPLARPELAQRVIQAAHDAGCEFVGSADPMGEVDFGQPEIAPMLRRAREVLWPN